MLKQYLVCVERRKESCVGAAVPVIVVVLLVPIVAQDKNPDRYEIEYNLACNSLENGDTLGALTTLQHAMGTLI